MKLSAGILVYRQNSDLEVLIVHPGGPYFARKDNGVWSIPKGLANEGESPLAAAKREFEEEIGLTPPDGEYLKLGEVKYPKNSKKIIAWAAEGDVDLTQFKSNTTQLEWPPRSGQKQEYPEVDRAEWCSLVVASRKMFKPQTAFLIRLAQALGIEFEIADIEQKQLDLL